MPSPSPIESTWRSKKQNSRPAPLPIDPWNPPPLLPPSLRAPPPRRGRGAHRYPASAYTHHDQVPRASRFAGNVDALWSSFNLAGTASEHWEEVSVEKREVGEACALETWIKMDKLRSEGRLPEQRASAASLRPAKEPDRSDNAWSTIVGNVPNVAAKWRVETRGRMQLARRVARLVQAYWDEKLGTGERQVKAEERRIKMLAKWTSREVGRQWKLAQSVVRAKRDKEAKEERDRLGRRQLRNILEESAQRLRRQQSALDLQAAQSDLDSSEGENSNALLEEEEEEEESLESDDYGTMSDASAASLREGASGSDSEESELEAQEDEEEADSDTSKVNGVNGRHAATARHDDQSAASTSKVALRRSFGEPMPKASPSQSSESDAVEDASDADRPQDFHSQDDHVQTEDAELEAAMWAQDESDSEEDDGLAADADMPLEELLKRYKSDGVGTMQEAPPLIEEIGFANDDSDTGSVGRSSSPPGESDSKSPAEAGSETNGSVISPAPRSRSPTGASSAAPSTLSGPNPSAYRIKPPFLLRGNLRPYQQIGFEWLASLYANNANGILADEMGLGKTIQTISLLAHLACDKGVWGPHLVVAPTSVMLNWEVEFKKFLPGFKILSYYGNQKERKEKRKGWNTVDSFNVCITSYQLVLADQHIFRRKPWVYLVLDEAHHIKNFRSQRWQTLLGFNTQRRLLLTGTPLQNNLMDLWSLMYFLMPPGMAETGAAFASMKDFQAWFSNPLDKAVESGERMNGEMREMVQKLHTLLRPYLLRRLKKDVEKELPSKVEHVVYCRLSKRQRFLYNDFMSRTKTRESLASGNYLSVINVLMQLRKVCNHPDLFEERPIVTSFAMHRSAVADYEIKEMLVRRELLQGGQDEAISLQALGLNLTSNEHLSPIYTRDLARLDASGKLPFVGKAVPDKEPLDTYTVEGLRRGLQQHAHAEEMLKFQHNSYINAFRCSRKPYYGEGLMRIAGLLGNQQRFLPFGLAAQETRKYLSRCDAAHRLFVPLETRRGALQDYIDRFAFVTPRAVATDMPRWALPGLSYDKCPPELLSSSFDTLHEPAVKLNIAFPDASLLQYDCGKLQQLDVLMRKFKAAGERVLIFTQMTRVLDILETFLNWRGYRYFRLDGATKIEQRQVLTERFNRDTRISAFILSTRTGGLGLNLTGASNVCFFDLDWSNASMSQAIDRAHRIGQQRDVHIYSLVSEHTVEENMLRRVRQKRQLDDLVVQEGDFTTDHLARIQWRDLLDDGGTTLAGVQVGAAVAEEGQGQARTSVEAQGGKDDERAFLAVEDEEDARAARATRNEMNLSIDFAEEEAPSARRDGVEGTSSATAAGLGDEPQHADEQADEELEGTVDDYMLKWVEQDWEYFSAVKFL
ncbi:hypothetical protein IE81DRAFT_295935 [Ceraceosorus guamensis]|uniref:Helicase SWR1 n=1 Tax=Ceraceosorus guamensis TaxID=1522189 RepID=A0A316VN25_9BASI|nr:hypothetical protein IE81DRAFT_295935 [Ceraceosorus guamensis]PWN38704.1 hypothetical protein IE81DRAFT_295935 [Ceraceosorus guamensis]